MTDRFAERVAGANWAAVTDDVNAFGCALLPQLLTPPEAAEIVGLYDRPERFRSTIDMQRHQFGAGQYRYFKQPFPESVERLRQALYPRLLTIARDWHERLGRVAEWPDTLDEWLAICHAAGQKRPTPILLRYRAGDWNALHQDRYGAVAFPLQVLIVLSERGRDYEGGEVVLVEQRPRAQSRGTALLIPHGHGLIFTTRDRPVQSARGWSAAPVRHGVSVIRSGERHTLGLVFHDAA